MMQKLAYEKTSDIIKTHNYVQMVRGRIVSSLDKQKTATEFNRCYRALHEVTNGDQIIV